MQLKVKDPFGTYPSWQSRPYGVRIEFDAGESYVKHGEEEYPSFMGIWNEASLIISEDLVFHFEHNKAVSSGENGNMWDVFIEGFSSASEAEIIGKKFVLAMMLASLYAGPSVRMIYRFPNMVEVYSRRLDRKPQFYAFASARSLPMPYSRHNEIIDNLRTTWQYVSNERIDHKLLLSLELYNSARYEKSKEARFIGIVSSIEPLAVQEDYSINEKYGSDVLALSERLALIVDEYSTIPDSIKASLKGQIKNLKGESVRKACLKLIKSRLPGNIEAARVYDYAYGARSKLLHEGIVPDDLLEIRYNADEVMRSLFLSYVNPRAV